MQPYNLAQLAQLRTRGQSPRLPVFVTNSWTFAKNLEAAGALSIHVKPKDAEADWSAIAGLEVILSLPQGEYWTPMMQAIRAKNPRRLLALTDDGLTTMWKAA